MDDIFLNREVIDVRKGDNVSAASPLWTRRKCLTGWITPVCFCTFLHAAFVIGDGFLSWVSLLHRDAQCMLKLLHDIYFPSVRPEQR